eukprot:CAMPEP_0173181594 /NCGR_PEP_ID=MMETSP1141-20130122/7363_1 /TAXON_ID=483371 /ORGANISM="non described non described, Strain CCMP2298" /LENGTH=102 /DNA_ID=CAMNT_0014104583 /DNA_START=829 /DNA_END=1137 /DNA_ORIENTATION=-
MRPQGVHRLVVGVVHVSLGVRDAVGLHGQRHVARTRACARQPGAEVGASGGNAVLAVGGRGTVRVFRGNYEAARHGGPVESVYYELVVAAVLEAGCALRAFA